MRNGIGERMKPDIDLEADHEMIHQDHELILTLKKQIEDLTSHITITERDLGDTSEQLAIHEKLSAQHTILRHIFYGVITLILMMGILVIIGWITKQTTIEREMAFFERIILVFIGIVGGAVSSFFDVRNFTISKQNGKNNTKDVD